MPREVTPSKLPLEMKRRAYPVVAAERTPEIGAGEGILIVPASFTSATPVKLAVGPMPSGLRKPERLRPVPWRSPHTRDGVEDVRPGVAVDAEHNGPNGRGECAGALAVERANGRILRAHINNAEHIAVQDVVDDLRRNRDRVAEIGQSNGAAAEVVGSKEREPVKVVPEMTPPLGFTSSFTSTFPPVMFVPEIVRIPPPTSGK